MHAALITGENRVELVEFPSPTPAAAGVVVDIAFCGICGTDIHAYQSGRPYNPAICGHEWAGHRVGGRRRGEVVDRGRPCRRCRRSVVRPVHRLSAWSGRSM